MNKPQRKTLLATAAVIALMVMFPPYHVMSYNRVRIMSGYGFLFSLPEYATSSGAIAANVNTATLLAQVMGALIVGGLIYVAVRD